MSAPVGRGGAPVRAYAWGRRYDVTPDGQRVYFIDHTPPPRPSEIGVVNGWSALLK